MTTLKEIADLAGVSRGTVDRVLNHRGSVNPKTAEKFMNNVLNTYGVFVQDLIMKIFG